MPRGNRSGPEGWGPRTGRGLGYCSGFGAPGYVNPAPPRGGGGWSHGPWGCGRGYAPGPYAAPAAYAYPPPYSREQERDTLQGEIEGLERRLEAVRQRLEELDTEE